ADMGMDYMVGADVAVFSKINVAGVFSVQPELHWIQKGVKYTTIATDNMDVKRVFRTNFIELPVLARFDFEIGDMVYFNIYAGPSVGYALNQKYIGENAPLGTENPVEKGDFKEDIDWVTEYGTDGWKDNRFDFSAVGGFGITFETEIGNFLLDARYSHDFIDAIKYENTPDPEPDKYYNRGVAITAGFAIPF
ncbi:MAG: hypothetical protein ACI81W_000724, partial [Saprospiraceae bacterium]